MKVTTWNVNSIHARKDNVLDWVERHRPDVLLLQETKTVDQEFPIDDFGDLGYDCAFTGERAYNGVAICAKDELRGVAKGLPGDPSDTHKRFISAEIAGIRFASVYVPNGQALDSDKFPYKLAWLDRLANHLVTLGAPSAPLVVSGDYNIAPSDALDVWDPEAMRGGTHVSPPERAALERLLGLGLTDAFRAKHPGTRAFSWWDYRAGAFDRDAGLRIDLHLVTAPIWARTRDVVIDRAARGEDKASDHAPVTLLLAP